MLGRPHGGHSLARDAAVDWAERVLAGGVTSKGWSVGRGLISRVNPSPPARWHEKLLAEKVYSVADLADLTVTELRVVGVPVGHAHKIKKRAQRGFAGVVATAAAASGGGAWW